MRRLATLLLVLAIPASAQHGPSNGTRSYPINPEAAPRPTARAVRTPRPIVVDAKLDEPEWQLADSLTDFVQQLPSTGSPAKYRTVTRVLYDRDHIYVSAMCYDDEPSKIITTGLERDFESGNSDVLGIAIDTYLDRRNSFLFLINPHGAVRDEQTFNDSRNIVDAWEGIIHLETAIVDSGWVVEMAIPTRTLRFNAGDGPQSWGFNVLRRVRRVNESSYWAPLDRQYRVHRMSKAGTLVGFDSLRQGRNLTLKPYALGATSSGRQVPQSAQGARYDAGLDLKYGVTPTVTLDVTTNTDFSQVEVDQEQVNLTRFSLFFPERREFFIENAGSFTFGDVQERNYRMGSSLSDFTFFNSRRIGLTSDGRPIPILGGARLSGRVGRWELGFLDMQTEHEPGQPAENFAVGRVRRNLFGSTDVGLVVLNRQATDTGDSYNRSFGADANVRLFGNMIVNSYVASTDGPGDDADGYASRVSAAYRGPRWNTSAMWKRVSEDFEPGIGFVRRRAMQQLFGTVGIHTRPRQSRIQELNPYIDVDYITDLESSLETRTLQAGLQVLFQPEGQVGVEVQETFDRLRAAFPIFPGVTIPAGGYTFREAGLSYTSPQSRAFFGSASISGGEFYDGTRRSAGASLTWRARYDLFFSTNLQRNDVDLPWGSFVADVASARARYAWSTRLFGSAYVQYNTQTKSVVTNARINFRYAPLSDVFVVFTERRGKDLTLVDGSGYLKNERSVVLKVTRSLAF